MLPPDVCAFEEASFRSKSRNSGERRYRIVLSILILSMTIVNGTVGELGRPSLIAVNHTILSTRLDTRIWIWIIKNTFELNLARFNAYDIYTVCTKKVLLHWTSIVLEIRDVERQDRTSVSF